ncbi:uncharacterized protein NPIL_145511 [Nephila pilipes]|uniref:Uncharacterized protein n=1 Tax=Nephila pilipes TaxID=299642 RepID=A0A8X6NYB3_NEPPI|nr:uncharacterized protein NPIL_145511 [Nephila pilipes]
MRKSNRILRGRRQANHKGTPAHWVPSQCIRPREMKANLKSLRCRGGLGKPFFPLFFSLPEFHSYPLLDQEEGGQNTDLSFRRVCFWFPR